MRIELQQILFAYFFTFFLFCLQMLLQGAQVPLRLPAVRAHQRGQEVGLPGPPVPPTPPPAIH